MHNQDIWRRLLSSALLIVIVYEWMRPLPELSNWTDVYSVAPILTVIAGLLAVDVLKIAPFWTWMVKLFIVLSSVAAMFHGTNLLSLEWWINFIVITMEDGLHILTGQWDTISAEGRTILFIGAWGTVVSWLYAIILYRKMAIYITMLTVIYLLTLQLWLGLDTIHGVFLSIIVGVLLHGLSVLPVLESKFGLSAKHAGWPIRWVMSSILLVGIIMSSGILLSLNQERTTLKLSSFDWNWQSIESFLPFSIQTFSGYTDKQSKVTQKSGYSMYDTQLGGAVESDDSAAFLANTEQPDAYWRGESKAIYDGKGWTNPTNDRYRYEMGEHLPDIFMYGDNSPLHNNSTTVIQEVFPLSGYPQDEHGTILLAQGAIRRVDFLQVESGAEADSFERIMMNRTEGQFMVQGSGSNSITTYHVESTLPVTSKSAENLLASGIEEKSTPVEISIPYVQLPEHLPERVTQLAHTVTDEFDTTWEKANAIEQYLSSHYNYTLTPNTPAKEGDFVDQFLFEQQEGYCDYFSTAMTVMLRSIGIPARWVKGFAPGEMIDSGESRLLQESSQRLIASHVTTYPVIVRNRDAHSWVEVYISGIGWTSFDPTPRSVGTITSDAELVNETDEAVTNRFWLKYSSRVFAFVTDRGTLIVLLGMAAIILCGVVIRSLFRSSLTRAWYEGIHFHIAMIRYRCGMSTKFADVRLLERIMDRVFTKYGQVMHKGETLREAVERRYYPDRVGVYLLELVSLYESARYGPTHRKRISYGRIEASWRLLR